MKKTLSLSLLFLTFVIHSANNQEADFRISQYRPINTTYLAFRHPDLGHDITDIAALSYLATIDTPGTILDIERLMSLCPSISIETKIDHFNNTLLIEAARAGSFNLIQYLLNRPDIKRSDIDAQTTNGTTALMHASENNLNYSFPIIQILLEKGSDPKIKDINGKTALSRAISKCNIRLLQELVVQTYLEENELELYIEELKKTKNPLFCEEAQTLLRTRTFKFAD